MSCPVDYTLTLTAVTVTDRIGVYRIDQWTSLNWGRLADDTETATVELRNCEITAIEWLVRHIGAVELTVTREGRDVFTGPILTVEPDIDTITIEAADISWWLEHACIPDNTTITDTTTGAAETIITTALMTGPDEPTVRRDSGLILPGLTVTDTSETLTWTWEQDTYVSDILDDLVDYRPFTWTTVADCLYLGPRPDRTTVADEVITATDLDEPLIQTLSIVDAATYGIARSTRDDNTIRATHTVDTTSEGLPRLTNIVDLDRTANQDTADTAARDAITWPPQTASTGPLTAEITSSIDWSRALPGRVIWRVATRSPLDIVEVPYWLESLSVSVERDQDNQMMETVEAGFLAATT